MAYGAKYHWEFTYPGGATVELLILEKDRSTYGTTFEIGHLQGLSLEIGGGSAPVYEPVVKTTLRFTIVDADDIGSDYYDDVAMEMLKAITSARVGSQTVRTKHGQWEEFYTNDPTKYMVHLKYAGGIIWSGFITPDSWQEDLYYHGSLTIVARDMLGTLEDKPFDAVGEGGSISVYDIIEQAVIKSEAAMSVTNNASVNLYHIGSSGADYSILTARLQVSAFEGRTWWDALTSVLESLGMVLRYTGSNGWVPTSLRYLCVFSAAAHDCEFVNHSGLRELQPPVRDITGTFTVDILQLSTEAIDEEKYSDYGNTGSLQRSGIGGLGRSEWPYPVQNLTQDSGKWGATSGSETRPPLFVEKLSPRDGQFDLSGSPYFLCDTGNVISLGLGIKKNYGRAIVGSFTQAPCKLTIAQDGSLVYANLSDFALPKSENFGSQPVALESVLVYITCGGLYYAGDGEWVSGTEKSSDKDTVGTLDPLRLNFDGGVAQIDIFAPGNTPQAITVNIVRVETSGYTTFQDGALCAPLRVTMSEIGGGTLPTENFVRLDYNGDNNVTINRTPSFGSVDTNYPPALIPNVLSYQGNALSNEWGWDGDDEGLPLEVLVQMQILVYYAATSSVFSGNLHDKTTPVALPGYRYVYKSRYCMVLRGTFDFTTGWINGVSMLEYRNWTDVWTSAPEWVSRDTRGSGGGSSGGSGGASSPAGGSSGSVTELRELVEHLDSLIGEDANRDAYVKQYTTYEDPEQEGDDPTPVQHSREFRNTGGAHFRDLTLIPKAVADASASAHLEVLNVNVGTVQNPDIRQVLHSRLPIVSDDAIVAGGAWAGSGGGGGGTSVVWGNDQATQGANYETLNVGGNTRVVALKGHAHPISEVTGLSAIIPAAASANNTLADKDWVNSTVASQTSTFRGNYNVVDDLSLPYNATHAQISAALANVISTATNNDYCYVMVPVDGSAGAAIASTDRYKYNGTDWVYEFSLNNSSFTSAQWDAINSGITSTLVARIPTTSQIGAWNSKISGVKKNGSLLPPDNSGVVNVTVPTSLQELDATAAAALASLVDIPLTWDEDANAWKLDASMYATGYLAAGGAGSGGSGGGGGTTVVWGEISNYFRPLVVEGYESETPASKHTVALLGHTHTYSEITGRVTALSQLTDDSTHRVVTDTQISAWNGKADASTLANYVTLASDQLISGAKEFSKLITANGDIKLSSMGAIKVPNGNDTVEAIYITKDYLRQGSATSLGTLTYPWSHAYLGSTTFYGNVKPDETNTHKLGTSAKRWSEFYSNEGNFSGTVRPATDADTTPVDLGTASYHWGKVYARGLYPAGASGIRLEYDASINGFKITGNLVATGAIVAGGTLPSNS